MNETLQHIISDLSAVYPLTEAKELAYWILEESTGMSRSQILTADKITKNIPNYKVILQRILQKEPIQYIFQHTIWRGLDLTVTPATLIPRPETAELLDAIHTTWGSIGNSTPSFSVLDIGTGSGCLAIALKKEHPEWEVWATDISADALAVAQTNATRNRVQIHFFQSDIFADEIGDFDMIVSNPPYIMEGEKKDMEATVLNYEPHTALFVPDDDPLRFYRRITQINKAPRLAFEINQQMGNELCQLLQQSGYSHFTLQKDSYGNDRILLARMD